MAKVGAAHCNPKKKPILNHNDRTNDNSHTINKEYTHLNEYSCSANEVRKQIDKLYKQAHQNYSKYCEQKNGLSKSGTPKGMQNFTKKERAYHEFIYEINEKTTMEQCQELTQKIAELTGFTPLQVVIHRDEIHENAKGEKQTHYHAHAVFFTLDKETGLQLARKEASLNPQTLSKIQDLTANTLQMQRGKNRFENGEKKQYIQEYRLYAQVQEAKKESEKELEIKAQELTKTAQILKENEKRINLKEKDLKAKFDAFKEQETALLKEKQDLELGHKALFNALKDKYKKKQSLVKNLFTFGFYHKSLNNSYNLERKNLEVSVNQADKEAEQRIDILQREHQIELEQLNHTIQRQQKDLEKWANYYRKLENELKQSKEQNEKLIERNKEYIQTKEILKNHLNDDFLKEKLPHIHDELMLQKLERQREVSKKRSFGMDR